MVNTFLPQLHVEEETVSSSIGKLEALTAELQKFQEFLKYETERVGT
jgi:hypothetical protein